jgi:hypothetical protein
MRKRKKRRPKGPSPDQDRNSTENNKEIEAAAELVRGLVRSGTGVKAMGVEMAGVYFVIEVRRADVITTDPLSVN